MSVGGTKEGVAAQPKRSAARIKIRLVKFLIVVLVVHEQLQVVAGDLIAFFDPSAQIDRLAALRTKGTMRIIFPGRLYATIRALDRQRHGNPGAYANYFS